jgi:hypothetical protein
MSGFFQSIKAATAADLAKQSDQPADDREKPVVAARNDRLKFKPFYLDDVSDLLRGRTRIHANNAEKQRAYRQRYKAQNGKGAP